MLIHLFPLSALPLCAPSDVDEDAETESFFDTQAGGAIKYTLLTAIVFCVCLGIMFAFLNTAYVPVTRYVQTLDWVQDLNDGRALNNKDSCVADQTVAGCAVSTYNWDIPVSFPLYVVAFMAFLGWFFFTLFVGVGFIALPLDLINEFRTRPTPMTTKQYFDERASLGSRTKTLLEIANKLSGEMEKRHTGSKKRQEAHDMRNLEKHYFYLKKDYQLLTIAYKLRGGNPLEWFAKLLGGLIFGGISVSWWIHIAIFILPGKPVHPFLNDLFTSLTQEVPEFPLFGVLLFALWSFHLLFCVVKGNFRLGVRFLVFKLYPMEIGQNKARADSSAAWSASSLLRASFTHSLFRPTPLLFSLLSLFRQHSDERLPVQHLDHPPDGRSRRSVLHRGVSDLHGRHTGRGDVRHADQVPQVLPILLPQQRVHHRAPLHQRIDDAHPLRLPSQQGGPGRGHTRPNRQVVQHQDGA